jgi:hypothetical protein
MKNFVLPAFLLLSVLSACRAQQASTTVTVTKPVPAARPIPTPFVTWDSKLIELGKVKKGEKRNLSFTLTNTSGADLQIDLVDACVCTTTDYPRGIIPPGGTARIDATFDSTEKEASETIDVNVVFKQNDAAGNARLEVVQYRFTLE